MFCPSPRVVESCGSPVPTPEVLMAQAEATRTRGRKAGTRTRKPAPPTGNGAHIVTDARVMDDVRLTGNASVATATDIARSVLDGSRVRMGAGAEAVTASNSDITDELEKGGPAFGSFLKSVGLAVAESQKQLDQDLVETAKALSDQQIDVIAIWEQQLDDDGNMTKGNPVVQKLPLINYLMPTAYNFSRVYLQADMSVSEFNTANGFNIQGHSASVSVRANVNYGITGLGGSGGVNASASTYGQSVNSSTSQDYAAGKLHMEATLEPRADIQLPKPFVVQKGPQLRLTVGSHTDIMDQSTPPKVIGRKVTLTAKLSGTKGAASGKLFDIRLSDPALDFNITTANGVTDANGELKVDVLRQGAAFDPAKPSAAATCKVWLNLLSQEAGFNI